MPAGALSSVFWAIIILWSRPAHGQDCTRFNTSRIPEVEPSSYTDVDYFSCADGAFLTIVDVWHYSSVGEFRWICSDGDTSYLPEELSSYLLYSRVTFDVGITAVETSFQALYYDSSSDSHVYLGDCYIGGYNVSSSIWTSDGVIFAWSGPFGAGDTYTEESWSSNCPDDSYATGVTWWSSPSFNFVNGIQLECAEITSTCYPPGLENQGDDDLTDTGADDSTTSSGADDSTTSTSADDSTTSLGADDSTTSTNADDSTTSSGADDSTTSTSADDSTTSSGADDSTTSTSADDSTTSTGADDSTTSTGRGDSINSTDEDDATDDIDRGGSNDPTSSGNKMVTIIASAASAAAAVVAIAVGLCLWCFFRSRHRESTPVQDTQARQVIELRQARAPPAAVATPVLSAPVPPSAYPEPPPIYQSPQTAARADPPPKYNFSGH